MNRNHRLTAGILAIALGSSLFLFPVAARASEDGRRNTAIALGAAAAILLGQRDKTAGVIAAAGAAYAYKRYDDAVRDRLYCDDQYDRGYVQYQTGSYYGQETYNGRYDRERSSRDQYDRDRSYRDRYDRERYNQGRSNQDRYDRGRDRNRR